MDLVAAVDTYIIILKTWRTGEWKMDHHDVNDNILCRRIFENVRALQCRTDIWHILLMVIKMWSLTVCYGMVDQKSQLVNTRQWSSELKLGQSFENIPNQFWYYVNCKTIVSCCQQLNGQTNSIMGYKKFSIGRRSGGGERDKVLLLFVFFADVVSTHVLEFEFYSCGHAEWQFPDKEYQFTHILRTELAHSLTLCVGGNKLPDSPWGLLGFSYNWICCLHSLDSGFLCLLY